MAEVVKILVGREFDNNSIFDNMNIDSNYKKHIFVDVVTGSDTIKTICGIYIYNPKYYNWYETDTIDTSLICVNCMDIDAIKFSDIDPQEIGEYWTEFLPSKEIDN